MIWSWEPIHIFRWTFLPFLDFMASNQVARSPCYPEARSCPGLRWPGTREPILTKLQGPEPAGFLGVLASDLRDGMRWRPAGWELGPCFGLAFTRSRGVCEPMQPHELSCQPAPGEQVPCCLRFFSSLSTFPYVPSFVVLFLCFFFFILSNVYFRIWTSGWLTNSVNVTDAGCFGGQVCPCGSRQKTSSAK